MLKQRIITGCCLAGLLLWAVFGWSTVQFSALLAVIAVISCWEWSRLCGLRSSAHRAPYAVVAGGTALVSLLPAAQQLSPMYVVAPGFAIWCAITVYLLRDNPPRQLEARVSVARMLVAPPLFFITIWGLMWLRHSETGSPSLFLYVFCIVWLADIGAYFAGRRWGKSKLAPRISPGKTREGALGGLVSVLIGSLLVAAIGPFPMTATTLITASLVTAIFSIYGDLFESAMKRSAGVKDSGAILPGHGGMLDRIDSVIAAVPVFVFIALLMA